MAADVRPGITALAPPSLIAWWALLTSVPEVVAAILFQRQLSGNWEWPTPPSGLLSVAPGVPVLVFQTP